ncbi:MAG: hypothetical protein K9H64_03815 [Bacteroidales bacterium]|nr:hypothetical protein [Bacteroidales bacterium]MCF8454960.1 hypothetical protein [Bacteroidales bacterium]
MDTDELSVEAYKAIITESELFNDDLTLQFGLLSDDCSDEDEFLEKSLKLIKKIKSYGPNTLDEIFFGHPPSHKEIIRALDKILKNIEKVQKIPIGERTFE